MLGITAHQQEELKHVAPRLQAALSTTGRVPFELHDELEAVASRPQTFCSVQWGDSLAPTSSPPTSAWFDHLVDAALHGAAWHVLAALDSLPQDPAPDAADAPAFVEFLQSLHQAATAKATQLIPERAALVFRILCGAAYPPAAIAAAAAPGEAPPIAFVPPVAVPPERCLLTRMSVGVLVSAFIKRAVEGKGPAGFLMVGTDAVPIATVVRNDQIATGAAVAATADTQAATTDTPAAAASSDGDADEEGDEGATCLYLAVPLLEHCYLNLPLTQAGNAMRRTLFDFLRGSQVSSSHFERDAAVSIKDVGAGDVDSTTKLFMEQLQDVLFNAFAARGPVDPHRYMIEYSAFFAAEVPRHSLFLGVWCRAVVSALHAALLDGDESLSKAAAWRMRSALSNSANECAQFTAAVRRLSSSSELSSVPNLTDIGSDKAESFAVAAFITVLDFVSAKSADMPVFRDFFKWAQAHHDAPPDEVFEGISAIDPAYQEPVRRILADHWTDTVRCAANKRRAAVEERVRELLLHSPPMAIDELPSGEDPQVIEAYSRVYTCQTAEARQPLPCIRKYTSETGVAVIQRETVSAVEVLGYATANPGVKEMHVLCWKFVCDDIPVLRLPGVSIGISAVDAIIPRPEGKDFTLDTSGADAEPLSSSRGTDGRCGNPGGSGGQVYIQAPNATALLRAELLIVKAAGGRGGDGESGRDGEKGTPGIDGAAADVSRSPLYDHFKGTHPTWIRARRFYVCQGGKGTLCGRGGPAGDYGSGGCGGYGGLIVVRSTATDEVRSTAPSGEPGRDGTQGKPGNPGMPLGADGSWESVERLDHVWSKEFPVCSQRGYPRLGCNQPSGDENKYGNEVFRVHGGTDSFTFLQLVTTSLDGDQFFSNGNWQARSNLRGAVGRQNVQREAAVPCRTLNLTQFAALDPARQDMTAAMTLVSAMLPTLGAATSTLNAYRSVQNGLRHAHKPGAVPDSPEAPSWPPIPALLASATWSGTAPPPNLPSLPQRFDLDVLASMTALLSRIGPHLLRVAADDPATFSSKLHHAALLQALQWLERLFSFVARSSAPRDFSRNVLEPARTAGLLNIGPLPPTRALWRLRVHLCRCVAYTHSRAQDNADKLESWYLHAPLAAGVGSIVEPDDNEAQLLECTGLGTSFTPPAMEPPAECWGATPPIAKRNAFVAADWDPHAEMTPAQCTAWDAHWAAGCTCDPNVLQHQLSRLIAARNLGGAAQERLASLSRAPPALQQIASPWVAAALLTRLNAARRAVAAAQQVFREAPPASTSKKVDAQVTNQFLTQIRQCRNQHGVYAAVFLGGVALAVQADDTRNRFNSNERWLNAKSKRAEGFTVLNLDDVFRDIPAVDGLTTDDDPLWNATCAHVMRFAAALPRVWWAEVCDASWFEPARGAFNTLAALVSAVLLAAAGDAGFESAVKSFATWTLQHHACLPVVDSTAEILSLATRHVRLCPELAGLAGQCGLPARFIYERLLTLDPSLWQTFLLSHCIASRATALSPTLPNGGHRQWATKQLMDCTGGVVFLRHLLVVIDRCTSEAQEGRTVLFCDEDLLVVLRLAPTVRFDAARLRRLSRACDLLQWPGLLCDWAAEDVLLDCPKIRRAAVPLSNGVDTMNPIAGWLQKIRAELTPTRFWLWQRLVYFCEAALPAPEAVDATAVRALCTQLRAISDAPTVSSYERAVKAASDVNQVARLMREERERVAAVSVDRDFGVTWEGLADLPFCDVAKRGHERAMRINTERDLSNALRALRGAMPTRVVIQPDVTPERRARIPVEARFEKLAENDYALAVEVLACASAAWKFVPATGDRPPLKGLRHVQMVEVACGVLAIQGAVMQIATGEGKTKVDAGIAFAATVCGWFVDVVTSSEVLVAEFAKETAAYFKLLGVTFGVVSEASPNTVFTQQVVISDLEPLQRFHLNAAFYGAAPTGWTQREPRFAVVDEFDYVALNKIQEQLLLCHQDVNMFGALPFLQATYMIARRGGAIREIVAAVKSGVASGAIFVPPTLRAFLERRVEAMVLNALEAASFRDGEQFVVRDGKLITYCVDNGTEQPNMTWSYGLTQFKQIEAGDVAVTPELPYAVSDSIISFLRRYHRRVGLTGTAGGEPAARVYRLAFDGLDTVTFPRYCHRQFAREADVVCATREAHNEAIRRRITEAPARPFLVVSSFPATADRHCQSIGAVIGDGNVRKFAVSSDRRIDTAECRVTSSTNCGGRGIDIVPTPEQYAAGGLYCLVTEILGPREHDQVFGRVARCGMPGGAAVVMFDPAFPGDAAVAPEDWVAWRQSEAARREQQLHEDILLRHLPQHLTSAARLDRLATTLRTITCASTGCTAEQVQVLQNAVVGRFGRVLDGLEVECLLETHGVRDADADAAVRLDSFLSGIGASFARGKPAPGDLLSHENLAFGLAHGDSDAALPYLERAIQQGEWTGGAALRAAYIYAARDRRLDKAYAMMDSAMDCMSEAARAFRTMIAQRNSATGMAQITHKYTESIELVADVLESHIRFLSPLVPRRLEPDAFAACIGGSQQNSISIALVHGLTPFRLKLSGPSRHAFVEKVLPGADKHWKRLSATLDDLYFCRSAPKVLDALIDLQVVTRPTADTLAFRCEVMLLPQGVAVGDEFDRAVLVDKLQLRLVELALENEHLDMDKFVMQDSGDDAVKECVRKCARSVVKEDVLTAVEAMAVSLVPMLRTGKASDIGLVALTDAKLRHPPAMNLPSDFTAPAGDKLFVSVSLDRAIVLTIPSDWEKRVLLFITCLALFIIGAVLTTFVGTAKLGEAVMSAAITGMMIAVMSSDLSGALLEMTKTLISSLVGSAVAAFVKYVQSWNAYRKCMKLLHKATSQVLSKLQSTRIRSWVGKALNNAQLWQSEIEAKVRAARLATSSAANLVPREVREVGGRLLAKTTKRVANVVSGCAADHVASMCISAALGSFVSCLWRGFQKDMAQLVQRIIESRLASALRSRTNIEAVAASMMCAMSEATTWADAVLQPIANVMRAKVFGVAHFSAHKLAGTKLALAATAAAAYAETAFARNRKTRGLEDKLSSAATMAVVSQSTVAAAEPQFLERESARVAEEIVRHISGLAAGKLMFHVKTSLGAAGSVKSDQIAVQLARRRLAAEARDAPFVAKFDAHYDRVTQLGAKAQATVTSRLDSSAAPQHATEGTRPSGDEMYFAARFAYTNGWIDEKATEKQKASINGYTNITSENSNGTTSFISADGSTLLFGVRGTYLSKATDIIDDLCIVAFKAAPFRTAAAADELRSVLAANPTITKAHVCGHSLGGFTAASIVAAVHRAGVTQQVYGAGFNIGGLGKQDFGANLERFQVTNDPLSDLSYGDEAATYRLNTGCIGRHALDAFAE